MDDNTIILVYLVCVLALPFLHIFRIWGEAIEEARNDTSTVRPPYLPIDLLIYQIVPRLPVRSIVKIGSVSKSWRSLLSNRSIDGWAIRFATMTHLIFAEKKSRGSGAFARCISVTGNISKGSFSDPSNFKWLGSSPGWRNMKECSVSRLVDVCNGLVLLRMNCIGKGGEFKVWNPVTKTNFVLPPARPNASGRNYEAYSFMTSLEYDPRMSSRFKVVCFLPGTDQLKFVMAVFASDVGDWVFSNEIETIKPLPKNSQSHSRKAFFLQGALYVLLPTTHLVKFDLASETFHEISLPRSGGENSSPCFGVSMGCLYYALVCEDNQLRVWMLEDFATGKWALRHAVLEQKLVSKLGKEVPHVQGLLFSSCFHPDKEAMYLMVGSSIFCYELKLERMNCIHPKSTTDNLVCPYGRITPYFPCLVNLKLYNLDDARKKQLVKKSLRFRKIE